jgi:hypothetical protein
MENQIEYSDSSSFRSFLDAKVAAYNHCRKYLLYLRQENETKN